MAKSINDYKKDYADARARGDVQGMREANEGANAVRASRGEKAQWATDDIAHVGGQRYHEARDKGDWRGMQHYNEEVNRARNNAGQAAQFANEDIEKVRRSSEHDGSWIGGVGGGGGGSYRAPAAEPFHYASAPSYTSKYQSKIDDLTKQILGRAAFEYDPEKDPTYQQYKESYTRSGERAMQDTLGQMSARTGGLASSYAGSAAQQTYDNYMGALADKIPELKQLAYSMYRDEGNNQRANLEMLMALEQGDYAKYQTLLGQYNTDRSFDYGVHRDSIGDDRYSSEWNYRVGRDQIGDQRYNQEWEYQKGRDQIADERYKDETAYGREQDAWEKANYTSEKEYKQALQKAQTLAAAGDFSGFKALGYTDAEISNLKTAYDKAQAAAILGTRSGGRPRGSGGGSGGGGGGPSAGIVETMLGFGDDTKAYEYLLGYKYSEAKTETLWKMYEAARDGGGGEEIRDASQLGRAAQGILNGLSRSYGDSEGKFNQIREAEERGTITPQEADFLLRSLGLL